MYEFIISNANDMNTERSSITICEGSCTPLSDTRCDTESLPAPAMVELGPRHQECNSSDVSGVALNISPSEGGRDGTSLNVVNDIVIEKPKHSGLDPHNAREVVRENPLGEVFELHNSSPDVVQDMSSRKERAMVDNNYGEPTVPAFRRRNVSLRKQSRRLVATVKRQTSEVLRSDNGNNTIYTLSVE